MTNPDRYLEDVSVGEVSVSEPFTVSEAEIIAFGREYDPQPFHTDAVAAKDSPFGGLVASGWQTAALTMRELVRSRPFGHTPLVGLGIDELRWLAPVRPGDRLTIRREILSVERSARKPDRGTIRTLVEVANQESVTVLRLQTLTRMPARP